MNGGGIAMLILRIGTFGREPSGIIPLVTFTRHGHLHSSPLKPTLLRWPMTSQR